MNWQSSDGETRASQTAMVTNFGASAALAFAALVGGEHEEFALVIFRKANGQWSESYVGPRIGRPVISPDGSIMHLGRHYWERTETGWSELKDLGPMFEKFEIMHLSSSENGTYVFDEVGRDGNGKIRYSRLVDAQRQEPEVFGEQINTGRWNAHPFIAPDESYMIWDGKRDSGFGDGDLCISFRQNEGSWGDAINLGPNVNTTASESGASVSPDGKYLFFNRNVRPNDYDDVDIFWVSAQVIEYLRPKPKE